MMDIFCSPNIQYRCIFVHSHPNDDTINFKMKHTPYTYYDFKLSDYSKSKCYTKHKISYCSKNFPFFISEPDDTAERITSTEPMFNNGRR